MADIQTVKDYINKLPNKDAFEALSGTKQEAYIFTSTEMLKSNYGVDTVDTRAVALQTLHVIDGDSEEYNRLKAHGVKAMTAKDVKVDFEKGAIENLIHPEVKHIMSSSHGHQNRIARIGRLI